MVITVTQAYVNYGRWVADCPRIDCRNALMLEPGQTQFYCAPPSGCHLSAEVEWPADVDAIEAALSIRPVPTTRNWAPPGHRQSVMCGIPQGQTAMELLHESLSHKELP